MSSGLLFRGLLIFIVCAIQSIESQDGRFCGEIAWTNPCSSVSDGTVGRRKRDSDSSIDEKLSWEANRNPPFARAWKKANKDKKLLGLSIKYNGVLHRSEIKLIMAYTYEFNTTDIQFYSSLNKDCRKYKLTRKEGKYPNTKRILRKALINLGDYQNQELGDDLLQLPAKLYRREPKILLKNYTIWKNKFKFRKLLQFTSTSRKKDAFKCNKTGKMLTTFINPQAGADIAEFSDHSEKEVLLPLLHGTFYVESVVSSRKRAVVVGPTTSSAQALMSNSKPCNGVSGQDGLHFNFVLLAICLVIAFQKHINL
ncbi:hypothetical protein SNE40_012630 [Patella caerulea]|uniref:NAD(P)(+)--arginine ADP-ribosyltransferase n=1 Tax=Patella caerulea TaxID=87958 RepID=A0AAN8JSU1_PATCE